MAYVILPNRWRSQPTSPSKPVYPFVGGYFHPFISLSAGTLVPTPYGVGVSTLGLGGAVTLYEAPTIPFACSGSLTIYLEGYAKWAGGFSFLTPNAKGVSLVKTANNFRLFISAYGYTYTTAYSQLGNYSASAVRFRAILKYRHDVPELTAWSSPSNATSSPSALTGTWAREPVNKVILGGTAASGNDDIITAAMLFDGDIPNQLLLENPYYFTERAGRRIYVPSAGGGAVTVTISEAGTLASSFSSSLLAKATLTESATLASSFVGKVIYPVSLEEVATLASTFSGGVLYSVSLEESGTLADSLTSVITIDRTISESATLDSGFTSQAVFSNTVTESATLASPLQGLGSFLGTFSESGALDYSLTSSVDSAGAFSGTIEEAATLAASFASVLIAKGTIAETATLGSPFTSSWTGSVTYVESGTLAFTVSANTGAPSGGSTGGGGGIRNIPLGQDYTMMVKMVDIDGTGVAGLTLAFTASKAGGAFNSISPSVTDRGSGWYAVTISAADLDTEGEFVLTVEGTGAETQAVISQVALSTQDAVVAALTAARLLTLGQFLALK